MRDDIKNTVKNYAYKLIEEKYPFSSIYVFGSYAKGKPRKFSDIDIAVISDKLKRNWNKNEALLWRYARKVDTRIEPIGFTREEFKKGSSPIIYEIKKTGVRIV